MTARINLSWRAQAKAVLMTTVPDASASAKRTIEFPSVWQAANHIAAILGCKHETAKKEIRKAIKLKCPRYGAHWQWKEDHD